MTKVLIYIGMGWLQTLRHSSTQWVKKYGGEK